MNPRMQMKYLLGRQFYIFADVVKTPKDDKQILSFMETLDKANGLLSKSFLNGSGNIVKKIANKMAVLEPKNGEGRILTGIENLGIRTFYQKEEAKS